MVWIIGDMILLNPYAYVQALEEKLKRLEQTVLEQDKHIRRLRNDQKMDRQSY